MGVRRAEDTSPRLTTVASMLTPRHPTTTPHIPSVPQKLRSTPQRTRASMSGPLARVKRSTNCWRPKVAWDN
ncbi:hypothetical protein Ahia01_001091700 [Argonauta hians]